MGRASRLKRERRQQEAAGGSSKVTVFTPHTEPDRFIDLVAFLKQEAKREAGLTLSTGEAWVMIAAGVCMADSHPLRARHVPAELRGRITIHPEKLQEAMPSA